MWTVIVTRCCKGWDFRGEEIIVRILYFFKNGYFVLVVREVVKLLKGP